MTIQVPDIGQANGRTGDNEQVLWNKVINNFTDSNNAASRIVGTTKGSLPEFTDTGVSSSGLAARSLPSNSQPDSIDSYLEGFGQTGFYSYATNQIGKVDKLSNYGIAIALIANGGQTIAVLNLDAAARQNSIIYRTSSGNMSSTILYCDRNTTIDPNGFIKPSSPVINLYDDDFELNGDAEQQKIKVKKNGTGDYTIKTDTGLRSDGSWKTELPFDDNNNPLFAIVIDAKDDGTINLKCYKRIFSMQTFTFGPDLDNPMDIPEGRFMQLRLNDNPEPEIIDEPIE